MPEILKAWESEARKFLRHPVSAVQQNLLYALADSTTRSIMHQMWLRMREEQDERNRDVD